MSCMKQNEKLKEELLEKEKKIKELEQMIHNGGSIRHGLNDPVSFLQRINRTFVNLREISILSLSFMVPRYLQDTLCVLWAVKFGIMILHIYAAYDFFSTIQYDMNESATPMVQRGVSLPVRLTSGLSLMADYITKDLSHTSYNATRRSFIFQDFCFIGYIREVDDNFRNNPAVRQPLL